MAKYSFYNTTKWRKIRQIVIDRAGGICEVCGVEKGSIAHHKIFVTDSNLNNYSILWDFNNLQCVCESCHNRIHKGEGGAVNSDLVFDGEGNLIKINYSPPIDVK